MPIMTLNAAFLCSFSLKLTRALPRSLAQQTIHALDQKAFEWKIKGSFWVRLLKGHLRIIFHEPKLFAKGSRAYMSDANV